MPISVVSDDVFKALTDAGVLSEGDLVRRVVIDLEVGCVPTVYVERHGDDRLLNVLPAVTKAAIVREERRSEPRPETPGDPDCPNAAAHSANGGPFRYCECGWMEASP